MGIARADDAARRAFADLPSTAARVDVLEGVLTDFWSDAPPRARGRLRAERLRVAGEWRRFPAEVFLFVSGSLLRSARRPGRPRPPGRSPPPGGPAGIYPRRRAPVPPLSPLGEERAPHPACRADHVVRPVVPESLSPRPPAAGGLSRRGVRSQRPRPARCAAPGANVAARSGHGRELPARRALPSARGLRPARRSCRGPGPRGPAPRRIGGKRRRGPAHLIVPFRSWAARIPQRFGRDSSSRCFSRPGFSNVRLPRHRRSGSPPWFSSWSTRVRSTRSARS